MTPPGIEPANLQFVLLLPYYYYYYCNNHSVPLLEALPTPELHSSALPNEAADTSQTLVTVKPHGVLYHNTATFTLRRIKNKKERVKSIQKKTEEMEKKRKMNI